MSSNVIKPRDLSLKKGGVKGAGGRTSDSGRWASDRVWCDEMWSGKTCAARFLSSKRGIVRTVAGGISTRIEPLQAPEFGARRSCWTGLGCVGCTLAVLDAVGRVRRTGAVLDASWSSRMRL